MSFVTGRSIPRRTFLRGMGTAAIGLPFLDAMSPAFAAAPKTPVRLAFMYVPNGIDMKHWNIEQEGAFGEFPRVMKPLEAFKNDMLQIGNLTHNSGRALLDGAGDHGRCAGSYLTGIQVKKTTVDIKASVSCDQIIANHIGNDTRFASLELGMDDSRQAGDCDSGYSCAYTNNLAWRSETQPLPPILDPRALFERLFGDGAVLSPEEKARQARYRRSILDFVMSDTHTLQTSLGPTDKRKLDEYLSSIREVERQLEKAERESVVIDPGMPKPYGVPPDFGEHFKLLSGMLAIAFQADLTRVATFLMTREGTSRSYREIGISDGHHPCTHHQGKPDLMEKVTRINEYHTAQLAGFLTTLKSMKEGDSNVLDNSMIVYGAGLSDGNRHLHEDLPTLLIGRGGGYFKPGRRIIYRKETPMCNLHLTLMDRMGVHLDNFGDASSPLDPASLT
ncbi:MAG TPA: DUF1552 domain-containing protein [Vicinamibacterales bacterium]|nr:DUF1552 domain-containing protein [Vicinamibacterales bacterium]